MDDRRITGEFTLAQATVPPNLNPFALAEGILGGRIDPGDAQGLSDRTLNQVEGRMNNIIARDGNRTMETLDRVQSGTANNDTVAESRAYFDSPVGQRFIVDPKLQQIIIDYVGAPDKDAARAAANDAVEKRMEELKGGIPGIMQELRGQEPDTVAALEQKARPVQGYTV